MKTQTPAEGILLHRDFGDAKFYTIPCNCGDAGHTHNVCVEADDSEVTVTTYTTQKTNWWDKTRWHHIWTLLTKGYVEYESTICMSQQQAHNYAKTLESAVMDVETFRAKRGFAMVNK